MKTTKYGANLPERIVFEGEKVKTFLDTLYDHGLTIYNFESGSPEDRWFVDEISPTPF